MSAAQTIRRLLRERALAQLLATTYTPPVWAQSLPIKPTHRVNLARRDTPIEPWYLPGLPIDGDTHLYIKRDDQTGAALSGNKVRKLEFIFADALLKGCDTIVTCGGVQSNHCRATAIAAAQLGMRSHVVLRSDVLDETKVPNVGNLLLDKLAGAQVHLAPRVPYATGLKPIMEGIISQIKEDAGEVGYLLPVGGSTIQGLWGYMDAFDEILRQGGAEQFDDVVVTCGSGGTVCGLSVANYLSGSPLRIHAITVCDDANYFYQHIDDTLAELKLDVSARSLVRIVDGYKGKGYGLSTEDELVFVRETAALTGIILDPVYTGKAALGLRHQLLTNKTAFKGNRILFVHTGGIFGAMDGRL